MDLLGVTALSVEVCAGEVKLGDMFPTSLFALPYQPFQLL